MGPDLPGVLLDTIKFFVSFLCCHWVCFIAQAWVSHRIRKWMTVVTFGGWHGTRGVCTRIKYFQSFLSLLQSNGSGTTSEECFVFFVFFLSLRKTTLSARFLLSWFIQKYVSAGARSSATCNYLLVILFFRGHPFPFALAVLSALVPAAFLMAKRTFIRIFSGHYPSSLEEISSRVYGWDRKWHLTSQCPLSH